MTPEQWQRLKALFQGALDQAPDQRDAWLTQAAGDAAIASEVRALLRADAEGPSPLDSPHPDAGPPRVTGDIPALSPGSRIGSFRIERELGRGGMGIVYKAFDDRLQRDVALKAVSGADADDPVKRRRLQNEALLAATIHHPGVATVYRLEDVDGHLLLATEYIPGQSLRSAMAGGPIGLQRALTFTRGILSALAAAHAAGVVHRDLKPENVMVSPGDAEAGEMVTIVDFGIARSDRFAMTRVTRGGPPGTPAYMAPEQLAGADVDARADIYAVGVMLAELVSGRHPGVPEQAALPSQLQAIVDRCLARDPSARFQSASEMLRAIDNLHAARASGDPHSMAWWRFHQVTAAVVYGLMLIPAWSARSALEPAQGRVLFLVVLAASVIASILRLHLCFTSWTYPQHLGELRARVRHALGASDAVFVLAMAAIGLMLTDGHGALTSLLVSVAIGAGVAAVVIEPATTRAAFGRTRLE